MSVRDDATHARCPLCEYLIDLNVEAYDVLPDTRVPIHCACAREAGIACDHEPASDMAVVTDRVIEYVDDAWMRTSRLFARSHHRLSSGQ